MWKENMHFPYTRLIEAEEHAGEGNRGHSLSSRTRSRSVEKINRPDVPMTEVCLREQTNGNKNQNKNSEEEKFK